MVEESRRLRQAEAQATRRQIIHGSIRAPEERMSRAPIQPQVAGLGLRACKGGAVVVCLALVGGHPQVVASKLLKSSVDGDRLSFEPYKVAAGMPYAAPGQPSARALAAVEEGRRRQGQQATASLESLLLHLEEAGYQPTVAGLLVNRAGWITDLVAYSLAWPEHVPVAELLAVRDALRLALAQCKLEVTELDEKSLPDVAAKVLDMSPEEITARTNALGATAGKPWRKEQKLACLAAWVAVQGRSRGSIRNLT